MKEFLKNNWLILSFELLVIVVFSLFYGSFGDINIDSFREAYIPQQILSGKSLYKDIFCIYSPLSYFINAVLFFIFGIKLKTLYFAGLLTTCGIIYFIKKLADIFLDKISSFSVCLLFIAAFVFSPNVFNPFFPYSYGLLYGLLFILVSIYFVIKGKFPASYLFYSLAICSKYEFILLLPLLFLITRKKDLLKNIIALLIPIISVLAVLFITGTRFIDLIVSAGLVKEMAQTKTLYWFYSSMGLIFRREIIPIYFENVIKFFIPYKFIFQEFFLWAFPVITILFAFRFRSLNLQERFFSAASIIISLKVFFALTLQSYGVFFLPFALISFMILIPKKLRKIFAIYFFIWSLIICYSNSKVLLEKSYKIETPQGVIKTNPEYGESFGETIKFFETLPEKTKVVVYPEGLAVNFLANRISDNKFYSLIPLYVETFGDNIIVKRLKISNPDYIVITDYNTSAYYYERFGYDYAAGVFEYIKNNYKLVKTTDSNFKAYIWKRN